MTSIVDDERFRTMMDSFEECFISMGLLAKCNYRLPVLMLLYSTVDTLSWLAESNPKTSVKKRFCRWVESWLLPEYAGDCSALDLYAARCSILHSMTYESELTRSGRARAVVYTYGGAKDDALREYLATLPDRQFAIVAVDDLVQAAKFGGAKFLVSAANDSQLGSLILERAAKFYANCDDSLNRRPPHGGVS